VNQELSTTGTIGTQDTQDTQDTMGTMGTMGTQDTTCGHHGHSALSMFFKRGTVPPYCNSLPLYNVYIHPVYPPLFSEIEWLNRGY